MPRRGQLFIESGQRVRNQRRLYRLGFLVLIGAALVLADSRGWLRPVKGVVTKAVSPVGGAFTSAGSTTGDFFQMLFQVRQITRENDKLERENSELRQRLADDAEMRQENKVLREQYGLPQPEGHTLIPARVIAYQPDGVRQFVTLGRGSSAGFKDGMAVVSGGSLVGRLTEVTASNSKVMLVTDPTFRVNALSQESRASGTISGHLGTGLVMDKIGQDEEIKVGHTIITSGLGGEVPKGIIIGKVQNVVERDNAVFKAAQVVTNVRFNKLEMVFVVAVK